MTTDFDTLDSKYIKPKSKGSGKNRMPMYISKEVED